MKKEKFWKIILVIIIILILVYLFLVISGISGKVVESIEKMIEAEWG